MSSKASSKSSKRTRKPESALIVTIRHTAPIVCGVVCGLLFLLSRIPNPVQDTALKFFQISYYDPTRPAPNQYGRGRDDFYFIGFWALAFVFLRAVVQKYFLEPIANWSKVEASNRLKFLEQGWLLLYYATFEAFGLAIWPQLPTWDGLKYCWIDYPHTHNPIELKIYFLAQWGFWIASIFMLIVDVRRKDFIEFIIHHFVVMFLVGGAFFMNFFRVAHIVLIEQDIADILLPLAKMFHYAHRTKLAEATFGIFVLAWVATRHVWFFFIVHSVYVDGPKYIGPDMWNPEKDSYHNMPVVYFFCFFFACLQVLMIFWLYLILKMIYRLFMNPSTDGKQAKDVRSDDEDEAESSHRKQM